MPIRGVILDVDGTLVDSNDAHAQAWVDALEASGYKFDFEAVRPLIGMGGDQVLATLLQLDPDNDESKHIRDVRGKIFGERYLDNVRAFAEVPALLEQMRNAGLKLVVGSSATQQELQPLLEIAGIVDLLNDQTSSDDAERSKPDPDIIEVALSKLRLPPEQVIMLGDTPYDIEAAQRAGVATVALRSGGWEDDELVDAAAIYDDPADLLLHFSASPFTASSATRAATDGARQVDAAAS